MFSFNLVAVPQTKNGTNYALRLKVNEKPGTLKAAEIH